MASTAFSHIANSTGDASHKVYLIHQALDDRFKAQGISVGFDDDRPSELNHMSRPEWVIRTLNCFFCGCENSGNLSEDSGLGLRLIPEMEEVGLKGCAKALRMIKLIDEEDELLYSRYDRGEISEDDYETLAEQLSQKRPAAEQSSLAEGFDTCGEALWAFALLHSSEILPDP